jgi:succinyl-diaminopimelate desuccinylase
MPEATPAVRARIAQLGLELLRIPSVTGEEAEIASYVRKWALSQRQLGRDDVIKRNNSLVIGHPDSRRPCLALVGHLDTVPSAPGDPAPYVASDRLVGRGASDMKGAVAVMQALVETLDLSRLPFALVIVLYDREEGPYLTNGLQPLLDAYEPLSAIDLAIAMEPTDNTLQLGCVGSIHARVVFKGRAAHSARPWQGQNAIHMAGPLLVKLHERQPRDVEIHGLVFRESVSATMAKGGLASNTVPGEFELNLNYRFAPAAPAAAGVERVIRELKELATGAVVEITDISPAGPVPIDNPVLEHIQSIAHLKVEPKQAWTDVARLATHGIDAVNFGPGSTAQAHQAGEWVSLDALVKSYEILSDVLSLPMEGI